jgi:mRNA-degrading endonuclease RelE of RelBE toxin-antitoxin system
MKPDFLEKVNKLPLKESRQIYTKLHLLTQDPMPDAKVKKQLKHMDGGRHIHRIRSGDYRIFYTFDQHYISVLTLRRRDGETYEDELDEEFLGGLPAAPIETDPARPIASYARQFDWEQPQSSVELLPEPITAELLKKLRIPTAYHNRLLLVKDRDALYYCPGLDDETISRIDRYMFETPLEEVVQQPDLVLVVAY